MMHGHAHTKKLLENNNKSAVHISISCFKELTRTTLFKHY